jgi:replication factor A3
MADSVSTPRINSQYLDAFTGKTVIIVGKVTQLRGESAIIDSEGAVTALLNRVRSLPPSLVLWSLRSINP